MSQEKQSGDFTPEFSRMIDRKQLKAAPVTLDATEAECTALAARFGVGTVHRLNATLSLELDGQTVTATGTMDARLTQTCAISGDDLPAVIAEKITLTFIPESAMSDEEEVELTEEELDQIPYSGSTFDLGEAVAQSLALAIDPYATGPNATRVRETHDLGEKAPSGPLQDALAKLKKG